MTDTRAGQFAGRVAFITGAGSGIGRATALAFAAQGFAVAASDNSEKAVHETARLIEDQGGQALPVLCDVTRSDDVAAAVAATLQQFGRLDGGSTPGPTASAPASGSTPAARDSSASPTPQGATAKLDPNRAKAGTPVLLAGFRHPRGPTTGPTPLRRSPRSG